MKSTLRWLLAAAAAFILVSCGGGVQTLGGIDRLGVTGPITGFASVIQSGIEWNTSSPQLTVTVDGQPATVSALRAGQVVTIKGTRSGATSTADSIELRSRVDGFVSSVDAAQSQFVVLGQHVLVDADTSIDPALPGTGIAAIAVAQRVRVSGYTDAAGLIHATRIDKSTSAVVHVQGVIDGLPTATTFTINGLTVDYATVTIEPSGATPAIDDLVDVTGSANPAGTLLTATTVEIEAGGAPAAQGELGHVEGIVTSISGTTFVVGGVTVITTSLPAGVAVGVKVEVEGTVDANGAIVAGTVEVRNVADQSVEIIADVTAVDTVQGSLTVFGAGGITVFVDANTRFEDQESVAPVRTFSLADVAVNDHLRIRAVVQNPGSRVVATRLEREDNVAEVVLRGPVTQPGIPAGAFTILGVLLTTDAGTQFLDAQSQSISSTLFFQNLVTGTVVTAVTTAPGGVPQVLSSVRLIPVSAEGGSDD